MSKIGDEKDKLIVYNSVVHSKNTLDLLFRYLTIKNPTDIQVLNWMIERDDDDIREAALSVVEKRLARTSLAIQFQALLLIIIHPDVSLSQLISDLREIGASENEMIAAARLIRTYLPTDKSR